MNGFFNYLESNMAEIKLELKNFDLNPKRFFKRYHYKKQ